MDLNTDNYTKTDIEEILSLTFPYSTEDVTDNKNTLHKKLMNDDNLDWDFKSKVGDFLHTISQKLFGPENSSTAPVVTTTTSPATTTVTAPATTTVTAPATTTSSITDIITPASETNILGKLPEAKGKEVNGHFLIDNPVRPGLINPLHIDTISRAICIDTRFRANYFDTISTDVMVDLPLRLERVTKMSLTEIEGPLSHHSISALQKNNTFTIETPPGGTKEIAVIPDGNYIAFTTSGANSISVAINAAMKTSCPTAWNNGIRYQADVVSGRSIFAYDLSYTVPPVDFNIYFNHDMFGDVDLSFPSQLTLGWSLGYRNAIYKSAPVSPSPIPTPVISEGVIYLDGPYYAYILVNDYQNNAGQYWTAAFNDSVQEKDIIARINLANSSGQAAYQSGALGANTTTLNNTRVYFGPVTIEKLHIKIIDEFGRLLDLNNMDWNMVFTFEIQYK